MPARHLALIRQVYLYCDAIPCVFARTVIPRATLSGAERHLAVLGNRPLGAVLFADPTTRRDRVEVGSLGPKHPLFARAVKNLDHRPRMLWGRRTLFHYAGRPLLVNEIFLPGIEGGRVSA
jgi:chorismate--pyruvate lyase